MASSDSLAPEPYLLRLADADNIAVATGAIPAGRAVRCGKDTLTLRDPAPTGHKIAIRAIRAGDKIFKFGCPIGSATRDIAAGEHVHTHNLKSDYLPTFTFEQGRRFLENPEKRA